jgi:hypothetical protein
LKENTDIISKDILTKKDSPKLERLERPKKLLEKLISNSE